MIRTQVVRKKKYRNVDSQYTKQARDTISVAGLLVMNEAKRSIQSSSGGGRTYGNHTASAAGQPPNTDTGFLVSNIVLDKDNDGMGADVESRADYSIHLEFGTRKMQARPFMQPALESQRAKIKALFKRLKARG
jgi:HK97 gp10 family phage protein